MGLLLQPPAEVLASPQRLAVSPTFSNADELICFSHHNHHMISIRVLVLHQITGSELLPTWPFYLPPREITEGGIRAQRGPA